MAEGMNCDKELLEAIRRKDVNAWSALIDQYQGRLLNYAKSKLKQSVDAEDAVQETFTSLLKALQNNPQAKIQRLDSYLFVILKNTICSQYRTRWARSVSLIQDVYFAKDESDQVDMAAQIASDDLSVSRFVSGNEQDSLRRIALTETLVDIVGRYKETQNFRDIKICDLLFFSKMSSSDTANILNQNLSSIRVFKHRFLKQIGQKIPDHFKLKDESLLSNSDILSDIWQATRLTCPKYSTLVNFVSEKLDPAWFDYIDFHLTTFGCHYCRASFRDIQQKYGSNLQKTLHESIMTSTIGFFSK